MNTKEKAKIEFEILRKVVKDAIILDYEAEILSLIEKFSEDGQSGGSAPITAHLITNAIENLMLHKAISPITGEESEWMEFDEQIKGRQNSRCYGLFKNEKTNNVEYVNAIVWVNSEDEDDAFTGTVYFDASCNKTIDSAQSVKFPFKEKTFYINVSKIYIKESKARQLKLSYSKFDKQCFYYVLTDPKQLEPVFQYYINPN